jgi:NADPH:quinone reductase-like Zn-dependent oxidoreductase
LKAAIVERYGPPEVVQVMEIPDPAPADSEVLVKALATTVNSGDARLRALRVPRGMRLPVRLTIGLTGPRQPVLGFEVAGLVEAVGGAVTGFRPGDRVVVSRGFKFGCHAELVVVDEQGAIARIPDDLSPQDAVSLCFGGATALHFFRRAELAPGETVLINGASGAVGTMAVQIAKHTGAEVTAVCSGANASLVEDLGASHVIDYTAEDFTRLRRRYDVLLDIAGGRSASACRRVLTRKGAHVVVGGPAGRWLQPVGHVVSVLASGPFVSQRMALVDLLRSTANTQNLLMLTELIEDGKVTPVIDRTYSFEEIPAAVGYQERGHASGKVVVSVS